MKLLNQLELEAFPRTALNHKNGPLRSVDRLGREWLRDQSINVERHAAALRPFLRTEFGRDDASPSEGHIRATNGLVVRLRKRLFQLSHCVTQAVRTALASPTTKHLQAVVRSKEFAHRRVQLIEKVWSFYLEIFSQRVTRFGDWLYVCDRIALDCYQAAYTGLGKARPVPAPPPFSYMATGRSPATFRRGVALSRLGKQLNPFPLIQLPYHRLVNPWTLGAILHEVSHNLQNDLGLARAIPEAIEEALLRAGVGRSVAAVWKRWNREIYADLSGLLLGGPAVVDSLMDVVGRSPAMVLQFNPRGVHPIPYFRTLLSLELLRRMGFAAEADKRRRFWMLTYPDPGKGSIPKALVETFGAANRLVVDVICFKPYLSMGDKSLADVVRFRHKDQAMTEEAAARLAAGTPTGILPERFLVGAARIALDRRLARPGRVMNNFYRALKGG